MGKTFKLKRGKKANLPQLAYGEPAYVSDEGELYIGSESGNVKLTNRAKVQELEIGLNEVNLELETEVAEINKQFTNIEGKKLDKNGILSMSNMGQDVKEAMTGGSVAVVGKHSILNDNIVDKQIEIDKISFLEIGENLLNPKKIIDGKSINGEYEQIDADSNCCVILSCLPNTTYSTESLMSVKFFTLENEYISTILTNSFTTPQNASKMAITYRFKKDIIVNNKVMVCIGETYPSTFSKYSVSFDELDIKPQQIIEFNESVQNVPVKKNSIAPQNTTFFKHYKSKNLFNMNDIVLDSMCGVSGAISISSNHFVTNYIEVMEGDTISFSCSASDGIRISANARFITAFKQIDNADVSSGITVETNIYTVPAGINYIRITFNKNILNSYIQIEKNTSFTEYEEYLDQYLISEDFLKIKDNVWKGKYFSSFGDSITVQGTWQKQIMNHFGFISSGYKGVNGSTVSTVGFSGMCTDERINTIPLNCEVLCFMGGANDWAQNVPLGDLNINNVDTNTFYGALNVMFKKLTTRLPNSTIIAMGTTFGKLPNRNVFDDKYGLLNNQGLLCVDYGEAIHKIARMWSIPFVDIGGQAGWNDVNIEKYTTDLLHPNELGGNKIASLVIGKLETIQPIV